jgi:thioredoxin-related protein
MKSIILSLLLVPFIVTAQTTEVVSTGDHKGIRFEHGLSWSQIQQKAKAEGKYVFVDAYTTWCGPCKYMAANIFPMDEVGSFFNANFINVKIQIDSTSKDPADIKTWYADAHDFANSYKIRAYPTYLFFDPQGNLVHQFLGSSDAKTFLNKAEQALKPETQYYPLLKKYQGGEKDPVFLRKFALAAVNANDEENGKKAFEEYLATQTDLYAKENAELIWMLTSTTADKGFKVMLDDPKRFDEILGKPGATEQKIEELIMYNDVLPFMFVVTKPDFAKLEANLTEKYPKHAKKLTAKSKMLYYQQKQQWANYPAAVNEYISKYGINLSAEELNEYAWTVFEHTSDQKYLNEALNWSKRSFEKNNDPMFIDTYANILYRLGKTKEAIDWETKAMSLAPAEEKADYESTLNKFRKGEKTWKE